MVIPAEADRARRLVSDAPALPAGATKDGTAGRILAAALVLFAEQGFSGASIRDVAAAAGVRSATLYAHHPSKEHLLAEIATVGHEEHHRTLRASLLESGPGAADQLAHLVRAHVRFHADYSMLAMVANTEMHALAAPLAAPALALRRQSESMFEDVIQRGIDQGSFDVPHPWVTMAAVAGMGLRVANWFRPGFELDADQVAAVHAELALRMVGATNER
ncbi:MAG TPA: TetR/AcrR family transcriptional regulator [Acidimicrobiales bacterium]|nr:TetR/AcrR family transcriptional regulator [Acidimicrobiales bacterium]